MTNCVKRVDCDESIQIPISALPDIADFQPETIYCWPLCGKGEKVPCRVKVESDNSRSPFGLTKEEWTRWEFWPNKCSVESEGVPNLEEGSHSSSEVMQFVLKV